MSYFAGIDLHKRYLTLCILDPDGNAVVQHRRLSTEGLFAVLGELDGPITVAVEATLHWAWLHDRLVQQGYAVQVADPGQVKLISKARCKTDPVDARKLADLVRTNLLPAIWVPDPTTRSSGGKTTHGSLPRAGSPWLRWALVEPTQTLKMKPGPVRAHFTRLSRAKGNSKATVAAARKLCCYLFWRLKEERTYPEWLQNRHSQPLLEVRPT